MGLGNTSPETKLNGSTLAEAQAIWTRRRNIVVVELSNPAGDTIAAGATKIYGLAVADYLAVDQVVASFQNTVDAAFTNTFTLRSFTPNSNNDGDIIQQASSGSRKGITLAPGAVRIAHYGSSWGYISLLNGDAADKVCRVLIGKYYR